MHYAGGNQYRSNNQNNQLRNSINANMQHHAQNINAKSYNTAVQGGNSGGQPSGGANATASLLGQANHNMNIPDKLLNDQL